MYFLIPPPREGRAGGGREGGRGGVPGVLLRLLPAAFGVRLSSGRIGASARSPIPYASETSSRRVQFSFPWIDASGIRLGEWSRALMTMR